MNLNQEALKAVNRVVFITAPAMAIVFFLYYARVGEEVSLWDTYTDEKMLSSAWGVAAGICFFLGAFEEFRGRRLSAGPAWWAMIMFGCGIATVLVAPFLGPLTLIPFLFGAYAVYRFFRPIFLSVKEDSLDI